MKCSSFFSSGLLCLAALSLWQAGAQPQPLPSVALSVEEKSRLDSKVKELTGVVEDLKRRRVHEDLLADVAVFLKAGQMLQEFPEEFFTKEDVAKTWPVLDQGIERGRQLLAGQSPWMEKPGRRLHGFYSALDGSVQPFGLRIPASYDGQMPVRLYVWLHGRDQRLTEVSFLDRFPQGRPSHTDPADEGQIQLDVYGRWNGIAFHWTGEADVFEAIAAVQKRYKIDPRRIILRGFSMGGCGAWHIALHHPDRFAAAEIGAGTWPRRSQMPGFPDYQAGPLRIYENINEWALNACNLPVAGHGGEQETGLSSIPPAPRGTPTRGQLESSIKIREQLEREGFPSEGDPYELRAKGTDSIFLISKKVGHSTSPEVRARLNQFLKQHGDRGIVSPDQIRFLTYTTRYNRSHWVTLDRLTKHYERSEVNAVRAAGGSRYTITTKNVTRLTLRETSAAREIEIDGQKLSVRPAPQLTLESTAGKWRVTKNGAPKELHKVHALQGPIDDAFLDPFLLVRPTGTPWNAAAHEQALRMLSRFDRLYAKGLRAHPRIKDDKDVTPEDFARYNVVLFGDPGSNRWIAKMQGKLPIRWTREQVIVGTRTFPAADHLPALIYPNPLHRNHYVVINSGMTFEDREFRGEYAMPRLGDFAVLESKDGADWPEIALAGPFDESWQMPKELQ